MSRRSKRTPRWVVFILLAIVVIFGCAYFVLCVLGKPYRTLREVPIRDYVENSLSLQGNNYRLTGEIESQILWQEGVGRVVSVMTKDGPIAVLFPPAMGTANLERGQRIVAHVEVGDKGILSGVGSVP